MATVVMSWNLSDFDLTSVRDDRQRAQLEAISRAAPDILCCQKLSSEASPTAVAEGFDRFASAVGMSGRIGLSRTTRLHVAVLWRGLITEVGPWVPLGATARRNAAVTTLRVARDRLLRIGSVHLPSASIEDRLADVERLLPLGDPVVPTVLAGDWNSVGDDRTYDRDRPDREFDRRVAGTLTASGLTDAARHLGVPWRPTWVASDWPELRIDAFQVNAPVLAAVDAYGVDESVDHLSHHRPIRLRLDTDRLEAARS